jgi:hypothetical protein
VNSPTKFYAVCCPTSDWELSHEDVIHRSLHAYAMEYYSRREAEKQHDLGYDDEYAMRCRLAANYWLEVARHYRRMAETFEAIGQAAMEEERIGGS